jgi:DNA-directed RNA polymerase subunit K/omega
MPPKAKKDKNVSNKNSKKNSKRIESELSDTESEQSNLSDTEFPQKNRRENKNNEEINNINGGNEEDDNLVDYDEAQGDDEERDKEDNEDDDDDENDDEGEGDGDGDGDDGKELAKNDEIKDDDNDDDDCVYRATKKGIIYDDDDDDDEDNFFEDDIDIKNVYVTEEDRITTRKLTKYERVNVISTRAKQIELGAQRMVKHEKGMTPKQIAKLELEMKVCPILIKRKLPSGAIELIDVNTLNIVN